jgi:hypothetical protein
MEVFLALGRSLIGNEVFFLKVPVPARLGGFLVESILVNFRLSREQKGKAWSESTLGRVGDGARELLQVSPRGALKNLPPKPYLPL